MQQYHMLWNSEFQIIISRLYTLPKILLFLQQCEILGVLLYSEHAKYKGFSVYINMSREGEGFYSQTALPGLTPRPNGLAIFLINWTSILPSCTQSSNSATKLMMKSHSPTAKLLPVTIVHSEGGNVLGVWLPPLLMRGKLVSLLC